MPESDQAFLKKIGIDIDISKLWGAASQSDLLGELQNAMRRIFNQVEEASKEYQTLGEDALTSIVCTALNQTFFFTATRETNSRGHVDITVLSPSFAPDYEFKVKGEAKIWEGAQYATNGFGQLDGYLTGRPPVAMMLLYFKTKSCDDLFQGYLDRIQIDYKATIEDRDIRFAITSHRHRTGLDIEVSHYGCHIPPITPPNKKPSRKRPESGAR